MDCQEVWIWGDPNQVLGDPEVCQETRISPKYMFYDKQCDENCVINQNSDNYSESYSDNYCDTTEYSENNYSTENYPVQFYT